MNQPIVEQLRDQRDMLAQALVAIVKEDAEGKGMFAAIAQKALERLARSMANANSYCDEDQ